jgi:hypothetical protein
MENGNLENLPYETLLLVKYLKPQNPAAIETHPTGLLNQRIQRSDQRISGSTVSG